MNKKVIIAIVVVVILVGGGLLWEQESKKSDSSENTNNTAQTSKTEESTQSSSSSATDTTAQAAVITFSNSGFSPANLTVKKGTTVTVKNESSKPVRFSSDPHPTHTAEPELNMAQLAPGASGTFTVTKVSTWGYHDHIDESLGGTLVVAE